MAAAPLPAPTVTRQLATILDDLVRLFARAVRRCRKKLRRARVHRLRTLARRLLAGLQLAETLGFHAGAKSSRRVKRTLSALSPLRDVQVQRKSLQAPELSQLDAAWLAAKLRRRARKLQRRAGRELRRLPLRKLERRVARLVLALDRGSCGARELEEAALARQLRERQQHVERESARVAEDPSRLHRLRLALKRYRYALAAVSPLLPASTADLGAGLSLLQDRLGEAHDAAVLVQAAESAAARTGERARGAALLSALSARQAQAEKAALAIVALSLPQMSPHSSEIPGK